MSFLDDETIAVECPRCRFETDVTLREIRLRDAIICRGCKATLQLDDYMCQTRKAQLSIERALRELEQSFDDMNITLGI